jgi:hypothetical protein
VLQMDVPSGAVPTHCERTCEEQGSPEGSIAEGYILEECLTFCSRFLDVDTKRIVLIDMKQLL